MMETKEKLVPKLRFSKFEDNWKVDKLNNLVRFLDNRRKPIKSAERAKMQGAYPYYGASGIIDYITDYIFDDELILLGEDGENIISRNLPLAFRVDGKCWVNNHAHVLKTNDNVDLNFLVEALEKVNYSIYNTGTAQPKLNKEVCKNIPVKLPSVVEQQKIASFLSAVDQKINQLQRKKELLQAYKKGMMQQLFSQKLKFKDEDGNDFPEWEEKKLGELFTIGSGKDYKHLNEGNIPVYGTGGLMTYVNEHLYEGESVGIGRKGTIDKPVYLNGKFWTVDTLFYTHSFQENVIVKFIYFLFLQINWKKYNEASGVPSLSKKTIDKIKVRIPNKEEQTKIATFLSALDAKIDTVSTAITQTQGFKKGLLQQMFV